MQILERIDANIIEKYQIICVTNNPIDTSDLKLIRLGRYKPGKKSLLEFNITVSAPGVIINDVFVPLPS